MNKPIFLSNTKLLVKAFVVLAAIHIILSLNITYASFVEASPWYGNVPAQGIRGANSHQFDQFVNSFEKERKAEAASNLKMTYFGVIPHWTRNVFFVLYAVIILSIYPSIVQSLKSRHI